MVIFKAAKLGLQGVYTGTKYHLYKRIGKHQLPTFMVYQVTDNCNSKCIMCNIWQKKAKDEMTVDDMKKAFAKKMFSELRWINLTGGEPFFRRDIVDVVKVLNKLPKLEGIAIPSNGFMTKIIIKRVEEMLKVLDKDKFLSVTLSIDGFSKTHEEIRRIPQAYDKVTATLDGLTKLKKKYPNFNVGVQPTIMKKNLDEIEDFYKAMKKKTKSIGFAVMLEAYGYYDNKGSDATLTKEDKLKVAKFLKKTLKNDPQYGFYYSKLIDLFETGKRDFGCLAGYITLFLDPKGNVSPCPVLSYNQKYRFGNVKEDKGNLWATKKAGKIKRDLEKEKICSSCTMMCDFINVAKHEFFEHTMFMMMHPTLLKRLLTKVKKEKNPYF